MTRREQLIHRLAGLADDKWYELWLGGGTPIDTDPAALAIADEADALRYLWATRKRYADRPKGQWLWVPWAHERARDLLGRGMPIVHVLHRLGEPARCRGLLPEELRAAVAAEAERLRTRAA